MRSPASSPHAPGHSARGRAYDRHSATGTRGLPKKNGAGGKGVWGAMLDQEGVTHLDENDPNYDPEEVEEWKQHVQHHLIQQEEVDHQLEDAPASFSPPATAPAAHAFPRDHLELALEGNHPTSFLETPVTHLGISPSSTAADVDSSPPSSLISHIE